MPVHTCAWTCGGQWTVSGTVPLSLFTLLFVVFVWFVLRQGLPLIGGSLFRPSWFCQPAPGDPPVSGFLKLDLQECVSQSPAFSFFNVGSGDRNQFLALHSRYLIHGTVSPELFFYLSSDVKASVQMFPSGLTQPHSTPSCLRCLTGSRSSMAAGWSPEDGRREGQLFPKCHPTKHIQLKDTFQQN